MSLLWFINCMLIQTDDSQARDLSTSVAPKDPKVKHETKKTLEKQSANFRQAAILIFNHVTILFFIMPFPVGGPLETGI